MKKKRKEKKVRSLWMLLLLTIVLLSGLTYAWFTSNRLVKVNSLDISVKASEGFQISVDGINWKSVIDTTDITGVATTYASHVNHVPDDMVPVSTAALSSNSVTGLLDFFVGTITNDNTGDYVLYAEKITESTTTGQFVGFDLFFRTNNEMYLLLEPDSGVRDNATVDNRKDRGMENSARIAFVNHGFLDAVTYPSPTGAQAQGLISSKTDGSNIKIWEPNYKSHSEESKTEAYNMYGISTTNPIYDDWISYSGLIAPILETSAIRLPQTTAAANPTHFAAMKEPMFVKTAKGFSDPVDTGIYLNPGVSKFRIYMWIEGQDYDCSDSASGSDIAFDLVLSTFKVVP